MIIRAVTLLLCTFAVPGPQLPSAPPLLGTQGAGSLFSSSTDIGKAQRGYTTYDAAAGTYEVMGGGSDVWGTADDFRFVWTRVSGDASLSADLHIDAPVTYRLAKGMLMFRQSLEPDSPYADIAMHADGHITLQYRLVRGGETKDVVLPENNVPHLRIVRRGERFTVYAGSDRRETMHPPSITVSMPGQVYVGLGVCSHNTDALQGVTFSRVTLQAATR